MPAPRFTGWERFETAPPNTDSAQAPIAPPSRCPASTQLSPPRPLRAVRRAEARGSARPAHTTSHLQAPPLDRGPPPPHTPTRHTHVYTLTRIHTHTLSARPCGGPLPFNHLAGAEEGLRHRTARNFPRGERGAQTVPVPRHAGSRRGGGPPPKSTFAVLSPPPPARANASARRGRDPAGRGQQAQHPAHPAPHCTLANPGQDKRAAAQPAGTGTNARLKWLIPVRGSCSQPPGLQQRRLTGGSRKSRAAAIRTGRAARPVCSRLPYPPLPSSTTADRSLHFPDTVTRERERESTLVFVVQLPQHRHVPLHVVGQRLHALQVVLHVAGKQPAPLSGQERGRRVQLLLLP